MKRKREEYESEDLPVSPFKVPKLSKSSRLSSERNTIALGDLSGSSLCDDIISIFQTSSGAASWIGGRSENQDCYYTDESFNSEKLQTIIKHSEPHQLSVLCSSLNKQSANASINPYIYISAIFDGHGQYGNSAAQSAKEIIPKVIHQVSPTLCLRDEHIRSSISISITAAQEQILTDAKLKDSMKQEYGTTAAIAVLWGDT